MPEIGNELNHFQLALWCIVILFTFMSQSKQQTLKPGHGLVLPKLFHSDLLPLC